MAFVAETKTTVKQIPTYLPLIHFKLWLCARYKYTIIIIIIAISHRKHKLVSCNNNVHKWVMSNQQKLGAENTREMCLWIQNQMNKINLWEIQIHGISTSLSTSIQIFGKSNRCQKFWRDEELEKERRKTNIVVHRIKEDKSADSSEREEQQQKCIT